MEQICRGHHAGEDQLTHWRLQLPLRVALTSWTNGPVKASWWSTKTTAKSCSWDTLSTHNIIACQQPSRKGSGHSGGQKRVACTRRDWGKWFWLWGRRSNYCVHFPGAGLTEVSTKVFSGVCTMRPRDKSQKLHPQKLQLCVIKYMFTVRVVKYWNRLLEKLWSLCLQRNSQLNRARTWAAWPNFEIRPALKKRCD